MKKILTILMIVIIILSLGGCSNGRDVSQKGTYFYIGQSNSWLATYSIIKVKSSYYDSLTIQYLFDEKGTDSKEEKIGPIEYSLIGNSQKSESSYPQELKGIANFHTDSRMNADAVKITFDEEIELTVKWKNKKEIIKLKKQS